ncbi:MAG: hypothetical protein DRQ46_00165 [Gammaproteobacteria bacterium]|nr:MAG: hypothetical protein DRQ46_00165 [Gammaproteobacteria bacterium]
MTDTLPLGLFNRIKTADKAFVPLGLLDIPTERSTSILRATRAYDKQPRSVLSTAHLIEAETRGWGKSILHAEHSVITHIKSILSTEHSDITRVKSVLKPEHSIIQKVSSVLRAAHAYHTTQKSVFRSSHAILATVKSVLRASRKHYYESGYHIYATDTTSLVRTYLGFALRDDLQLTNITLADGEYDIEFVLQGYLWKDEIAFNKFRVEISSGAAEPTAPPDLINLTYAYLSTYARFFFTWKKAFGDTDPWRFYIWYDTSGTPVITGDPDYVLIPDTPRQYNKLIPQDTNTLYVTVQAVAADLTKGTRADLTIPAAPVDPNSPVDQFALNDEIEDIAD